MIRFADKQDQYVSPGAEEDSKFTGKEKSCTKCKRGLRTTPQRRLLCRRCYERN